MHIALNGWFWDQPNTGSGQYLRHLLAAMRRIAPDVTFTLVLPPHLPEPQDVPPGVAVVTAGGSGGAGPLNKVWFEQRGYPAQVKRLGAQIAHVPYWGPPLASPARLVTSVLDVIPLALPEYGQGLGNRAYIALVSAAAGGSAHVITLSAAARDDITTYLGIPAAKITPTHLGIDDRFHPRMGAEHDAAVREKYGLPQQFVLYLGGFDSRKQVNQLLLAYTYVAQAEGDHVPLVLAGREPAWGQSPVFPDLRAYAAELGLADMVRWIGFVDEADKPALYRLADVFAWPSLYEGFGLPPLEAMACGTPVVAFEVDYAQEILAEGAYLVGNARAMAGGILALLNQEPLRRTMVNQGIARATHFTWRKTARATLDVYEAVLRL